MSNNLTTAPKVLIEELVYKKIMHWVQKSQYEVSGLGMVKRDEKGNLMVIDAILLPQKNTSVTTDIDPTDIGKAMFEMRNAEGEMKFWWHSHVNMDVFWSGTDAATIVALGQGGWFISTVFNKKEKMKTCLSTVEPWFAIIDDITTQVVSVVDKSITDKWDTDYDRCVTNFIPKIEAPKFNGILQPRGGWQEAFSPFGELEEEWGLGTPGAPLGSDFGYPSYPTTSSRKSFHSISNGDVEKLYERREAYEMMLDEVEAEIGMAEEAGLMPTSSRKKFQPKTKIKKGKK